MFTEKRENLCQSIEKFDVDPVLPLIRAIMNTVKNIKIKKKTTTKVSTCLESLNISFLCSLI